MVGQHQRIGTIIVVGASSSLNAFFPSYPPISKICDSGQVAEMDPASSVTLATPGVMNDEKRQFSSSHPRSGEEEGNGTSNRSLSLSLSLWLEN